MTRLPSISWRFIGVFETLVGKKTPTSAANDLDEDDDFPVSNPQPIKGPPEFIRAVEMQQRYWTHNPHEQAQLEAKGAGRLDWHERLRLHHLICLQRLDKGT